MKHQRPPSEARISIIYLKIMKNTPNIKDRNNLPAADFNNKLIHPR